MNYNINNFFKSDECGSIIEYAERVGKKFNYNHTEVWDCKTISDLGFNNMIIDRFVKNYQENDFKLWFPLDMFEIKDIKISLTKYYDGRRLDLHLDAASQLTTVVVLSDNFFDGRFILSENNNNHEKYDLKIGQSISFDGSKIHHGVTPVTNGIRIALNIWMTNTDIKFFDIPNQKRLI